MIHPLRTILPIQEEEEKRERRRKGTDGVAGREFTE